jgi:glutamine---fructose-6-phosphate transaminase (isomerizing)
VPSERNAHPQVSGPGVALVHNGIIENHEPLRRELQALGYVFESETDTEVVAHRIRTTWTRTATCSDAVRAPVAELEGAYALAVSARTTPTGSWSRAPAARWSSGSASARTSSPPTSRRCCR